MSYASDDISQNMTVITVPLDFNSQHRDMVKECAKASGFHVAQVISEPAAATLAYELMNDNNPTPKNCLIYRCGGASLTLTVVQVNGNM